MGYKKHLREDQWLSIKDMLPGKKGDRGRSGVDNRRFIEAVIWIGKNGAKWRSLPAEYGAWSGVHKGYDGDTFINAVHSSGAQAVVPPRKNRSIKRDCDYVLYKERNKVECMFGKLKQWRRIATRYDKTDQSFMAFILLASITLWLN